VQALHERSKGGGAGSEGTELGFGAVMFSRLDKEGAEDLQDGTCV
jgi:hypothetical protein